MVFKLAPREKGTANWAIKKARNCRQQFINHRDGFLTSHKYRDECINDRGIPDATGIWSVDDKGARVNADNIYKPGPWVKMWLVFDYQTDTCFSSLSV